MAELTRRLAAVAFADVAGWSKLIGENDAGTLLAWKALRAELIEPKIERHNGRLLEVAGDAVVVEFPSAVAAVSWAIEVQREISRRETQPAAIQLALRIGINVEDVIVDGDKLVGDGVNIAARIHPIAAPGEIIVTSTVRDYVVNKLAVHFEDLGMRELKHISRPIRVYRVGAQAAGSAQPSNVPRASLGVFHSALDVRTMLAVDFEDPVESPIRSGEWPSLRRVLSGEIRTRILPLHGGQVLEAAEHGLLLDFPRLPTAVKAAFDIQRACHQAGTSSGQHMLPRMGLQIGELGADDSGLLARGATLANRLTAIAGPGEIVVSAAVRDRLTPFLDADIEDLGECYLKHLPDPVRAYRVGPPGPRPVIEPGYGDSDLRPTIAVIPFTLRTHGAQNDVVGEVLADEVISALSRAADMNVISRLSTTTFRGRDATLEEVSALLGANYILSGAYHLVGTKFNLVVELAEAKSRRVVWSNDVKGDVAGIVTGEDDLISRIVLDVSTAVTARELQKAQTQALPTLESYTLLMGAISLMHRLSRHDFNRSRELLETLTDRAPRQAIPQAWLAKWHVLRVWQGWSSNANADAELALDCTRRALDSDAHCSLALVIDGLVHTNLLKQLDVAEQRYELALCVNPNDSLGWLLQGTLHAFKGEGKQALSETKRALALSPLDPMRYFYDSLAATAALSAKRYEQAIERAQRSLRANRTHASTLRALAIAQWELGREEDARKTVTDLLRIEPNLTISNYLERSPSSAYETGRIWSRALHAAGVPM